MKQYFKKIDVQQTTTSLRVLAGAYTRWNGDGDRVCEKGNSNEGHTMSE